MEKRRRNNCWKILKKKKYVAHRGLFDPSKGIPENSLEAFKRAVEHDYPVELDVRLTLDKKLIVFHDEDLKRMCGIKRKVADCTYNELSELRLSNTDSVIPLFTDVLKVLDGKVAAIVEIKSDHDWKNTARLTARYLDRYSGPAVIESFHPLAVNWFKKHRPGIFRGQLSTDFSVDAPEYGKVTGFLMTNMAMNFLTKPDFVAYNLQFGHYRAVKKIKNHPRIRLVAWTVKSQKQLDRIRDDFDVFIFDSFIPK